MGLAAGDGGEGLRLLDCSPDSGRPGCSREVTGALSTQISGVAAVSFCTPSFRRRLKSPLLSPPSPPSLPRFPPRLRHTFEIGSSFMTTSAGTMNDGSVKTAAGEIAFFPILEKGVFRFDCSVNDRDAAFPSLSFVDPKARETPIAGHGKLPEFLPSFEQLRDQQIVMIQIFTWNTDAWGYSAETTSLYQSHPWVLAVLPDGKALGVLADTTRRCEIDLREISTIKLSSASAYPVITFGPFNSPAEVLISLSHAIGCILNPIWTSVPIFRTVFMPPKWSLGYHQCRWSYETDERVRQIATNFRERGIPCDVIWMDIDYMHGFRCFTFDEERFPDPKTLVEDLHAMGIHAIWMLDPGIKHEEGYHVFDSGTNSNVWILKEDGDPFVGEVWPGTCVFPDFTQKEARLWWANLVKDFVSNGVDGIWNDMNEPAVFKTVTKTMPENNIHNADAEFGEHPPHGQVFGMLMARSTYEGMKMANEKRRPFVLTRSGFIGSQRYAATWTGDNLSTWEHLHMSIPMVLQLGLSGQPLSGPDIGGFAGNATPKLFGRWMGVGAMFPFCRGHSESRTTDHEPWSFGEECEEVCRLALLRRYRLIPHIYTLFYEAHKKGIPVLSPTFFAGKAEGVLFEDDCDGYGYTEGAYLQTFYAAELKSSTVTLRINGSEGSWRRPNRSLHVHILLGGGAMIDGWGTDGEEVHITMPSESEVSQLKSASESQYRDKLDKAKLIPDANGLSGKKGIELSKTPVKIKSRDWLLEAVPWIGGRVISMIHLPSGDRLTEVFPKGEGLVARTGRLG
ncbi:putative alpha-xylosidase 2 [Platanthera guangdongensis]|uniref:Alpha-xylosidase 2 n=1 Tax=Platanthera guangdongensis TaxID=2320717 RepID=A0ABR2LPU2_9ASPA